jgi:hypothetical protein
MDSQLNWKNTTQKYWELLSEACFSMLDLLNIIYNKQKQSITQQRSHSASRLHVKGIHHSMETYTYQLRPALNPVHWSTGHQLHAGDSIYYMPFDSLVACPCCVKGATSRGSRRLPNTIAIGSERLAELACCTDGTHRSEVAAVKITAEHTSDHPDMICVGH